MQPTKPKNYKTLLFIANWKMNMPVAQAWEFLDKHREQLEQAAQENNAQVVLCPSFLALDHFCRRTGNHSDNGIAKNSWLQIGAQDCSEHTSGAYTGQIDASSLAFMGCSYGIVGHSERRKYYGETDEIIAEKVARLTENGITPILCIGETEQEFANKKTKEVLARQLKLVIARLAGEKMQEIPKTSTQIIIAYEPVYAIGTGAAPDTAHLTEIFGWLHETVRKSAAGTLERSEIVDGGQAENKLELDPISKIDIRLVYGGSVTENNAQALLAIPHVSGLLIGNASLDFQKFQNIVSSNNR